MLRLLALAAVVLFQACLSGSSPGTKTASAVDGTAGGNAGGNAGGAPAVGPWVDVRTFGAKGDGATDDTAAVQAALDNVRSGGTLFFPSGLTFLVDGAARAGDTSVALEDASSVRIVGYGATLVQGRRSLRLFGVFRSTNVIIEGLRIIGSTYRAGNPSWEHAAGIAVNYGSDNVWIRYCHIDNFLGDCIYAGGSLYAGGETGRTVSNLRITHCTLKTRVGNGVRSYYGGSMSRCAIAPIDVRDVDIGYNLIYGIVDLEPNLNGQVIGNVVVHDNRFACGPVIPQADIGSDYNFEEHIAAVGAAIYGQVAITGIPGKPVIYGNAVVNNVFDNGYVTMGNVYVFDVVGNMFGTGQILIGSAGGPNATEGANVSYNMLADGGGSDCFIRFDGSVYRSSFVGNVANVAAGYVIAANGAWMGNDWSNSFSGNVNSSPAATGILGFLPPDESLPVTTASSR